MQNKIFSVLAITIVSTFTAFAQLPDSLPSQGLVIGMNNGLPVVEKVYFGTAGATAGFQAGDTLLAVGDTTTAGLTPRDIGYMLDYNPGSSIGVAVQRDGAPQYLILNRRSPKEQWKMAYKQDKETAAATKLSMASSACPPSEAGDNGEAGEFSVGEGKISYTSPDVYKSNSTMPNYDTSSYDSSSVVSYDTVYSEMMRIRQQLAELTHSVDVLNAKVDHMRPSSSASYGRPPVDNNPIPDTVLPPPPPQSYDDAFDFDPDNIDTYEDDMKASSSRSPSSKSSSSYDMTPSSQAPSKPSNAYPGQTVPSDYDESESAPQTSGTLHNDRRNPIADWWNSMPENQDMRGEFDIDSQPPENETFLEEIHKFDDIGGETDATFPENSMFQKTDPSQGHAVDVSRYNSKKN